MIETQIVQKVKDNIVDLKTQEKLKDMEDSDVLSCWSDSSHEKVISKQVVKHDVINDLEGKQGPNDLTDLTFAVLAEMSAAFLSATNAKGTSRIILRAVSKGFGIKRALCLVYDPSKNEFTGHLMQNSVLQELTVSADLQAMKSFLDQDNIKDIEYYSIQQMAMALNDRCESGKKEKQSNLHAGTGGLCTTFFRASKDSLWPKTKFLGSLIVDIVDREDVWLDVAQGYKEKLGTLAMIASGAIERILMTQSFSDETHALAKTTEKLDEVQKQLFHLHRLATVGQLAASVAHEINNPLTIISLNIQLMEQMIQNNPVHDEMAGHLRMVANQEERVVKIVNDMLDFSRPAQPQFRVSSADEIIDNVLSMLGTQKMMQKVKINKCINRLLPSIMVDPKQIEQVCMNLVINASHAMPEGGTILISGHDRGDFVEISVSDTGEGISKDNLEKIFDPFFTTKGEKDGSGLGLAISASIIEHNGGKIMVKSVVGVGTIFRLQLPVDKESLLRAVNRDESSRLLSKYEDSNQHNILVIDDDYLLNKTLQHTLEDSGYAVAGAYDGVEGLRMLRTKRYHLILLDIRMPRKDGLEVLKLVKEELPDVRVIIITGHVSQEELKITKELGAYACLRKPFRIEKALDAIDAALTTKQ